MKHSTASTAARTQALKLGTEMVIRNLVLLGRASGITKEEVQSSQDVSANAAAEILCFLIQGNMARRQSC